MKKLFTYIVILLFLTPTTLRADEILISAAISLQDAFREISEEYAKANPGERANLNFASSGQLKKQIEIGARADVFASASSVEMDALEEQGLVIADSRRVFARNSLVIISYKKISDVKELESNKYKKIAMGNPVTVPAGKYAKEAFEFYQIYDNIQPKLILTENVRQALDYVAREVVDAGVVYYTDTLLLRSKSLYAFMIFDKAHTPIKYPIAIVTGTKKKRAARRFIDFVISERGQGILLKHGFKTIYQ